MERLRQSDIEKLLSALNDLHFDINPSSLRERLLNAVKAVVSSEIVAFDIFNSAGVHQGVIPYDPIDALTAEDLQIFADHVIEHPFFTDIFLKKRFEALKISDFISNSKFHQTGIYNEFYRRVGVERQIAVALPVSSDQIITCAFSRSQQDFTENDRLLLNLLVPHLTQAVRNTQTLQRLQAIIESQSNGVIALNGEGNVQYISESAKLFLGKYFDKGKPNTGILPEMLNDWIKEQFLSSNEYQFTLSTLPLIIENETGKLQIRLLYNSTTKEKTLLLEEKATLSPEKLKLLNLTNRETEILFWMAQGKANSEISILCGISLRTVQKHSERIYIKLGVETRTAAMLRAFEVLEK